MSWGSEDDLDADWEAVEARRRAAAARARGVGDVPADMLLAPPSTPRVGG